MAKSLLRLKARKLRKRGISVKKISQVLGVSKSSASTWVRDIILSVEQLEKLRGAMIKGQERGRLNNALMQKHKWQNNMEDFKKAGKKIIEKLSGRELLITGLALYWGEGCKKVRRVQFCNSDPKMIEVMLNWLHKCLAVDKKDIRCRVGINLMHFKREKIVKEYWSNITGIPLDQFTKTSFKKVKNQKTYDNFNQHYGTLAIEVMHPSRFYGKILGLIEGLYEGARVAQRQ